MNQKISIHINRIKIVQLLIAILAFLFIINIAINVIQDSFMNGNIIIQNVFSFLHFDKETNLPTFFNTLLLLVNAVVFYFIGITASADRKYWFLLAFVFLYLTFDEFASIHEKLNELTPILLNFERKGLYYFAWIIPYGILVWVLALFLSKFIFRLPKCIFKKYIIAAVLYLLGVFLLESLSGFEYQLYAASKQFYFLSTIEETLEMSGLIVSFNASILYLVSIQK